MTKTILFIGALILAFAVSSCSKRNFDTHTSLWGIVSDAVTNDPISGANVTMSPGGRSQVTGSDGRFEFKDLEPQQYTITVQRIGYQTNRRTITAVVGEKTEANIQLTPNP